MPGCCVESCKNRSEKGFRLFRIPTGENNKRRKELWLKLINRNTLSARAVICEVHFDNDQFEEARQDGKKLLRPNAKPNLLKKCKTEEEKKEERDIAKKAAYSNINHIQDLESHDYTETINVEAINTETTNTEATNINILRDTASNTINEKEQIKHLKIRLKRTLQQCSQMKKKLQQKNINFEKIFTKDQIEFIANNTQRGASWSIETLNKALKLYVACGQKGYEEVRRQNMPYPSIRTIQHHIQGLKCKPGERFSNS
jgi:hypothetical protein